MASTLSSSTFLLKLWFLPVFDVVFLVNSLIVMSYWLPMHLAEFSKNLIYKMLIEFLISTHYFFFGRFNT